MSESPKKRRTRKHGTLLCDGNGCFEYFTPPGGVVWSCQVGAGMVRKCFVSDCTQMYMPHHWGSKRAVRFGWFIKKNGDAWCMNHTPEWVVKWRAKKASEKEGQ